MLNTSRISRFGRIALFAIAALAAGCSGSNPPANYATPALSSEAAAAEAHVTIIDASYKPKTLRTKVGMAVKFLNKDYEAHTVTADDNSYSSSILTRNHAYKHTFSKPGKYPYHCKIHPYMTGTVIVTK
jgi:plastocyanin